MMKQCISSASKLRQIANTCSLVLQAHIHVGGAALRLLECLATHAILKRCLVVETMFPFYQTSSSEIARHVQHVLTPFSM